MLPFARSLAVAGGSSGLAVWRVRYRLRGWNGTEASPVRDVAEVLELAAHRHPGVPVALVGYSMGGRVALTLASRPGVRTVVALAPWVTESARPEELEGRHALFMHGARDRTTDAHLTAAFAMRVAPLSASCGMVGVRGDGHAMVRRPRVWHRLTTGFVLSSVGFRQASAELTSVLERNGAKVEL
ncbi:alpha/beta fold hydrolase [Phytoactinopolyspora alkaliphila]|uniref:Alpha/beta fold hydrolase n=2 Tax=Phytoactinopolyspora alkaliphila TaxID=1783498 RepID=A0A6N9YFK3_9ACTN|nr:alpha/beta fold hydrolase [Phytoactinopolyspora alkaliphila]NED93742.1 alpha/beta fold hydrolase [Phytoactinopolyspora alkaliphila]